MRSFLAYLTLAAMGVTGAVLIWGLVEMVRGKDNREKSNKIMQYRVFFQGAALLLFTALFYFGR